MLKRLLKKGGFPRFKKKGGCDNIHFPQGFKVSGNKVYLPKIGWVKFFKTRDIIGKIKNVTVSSDGLGHWYVSVCTEEMREVATRSLDEVGLDLGITNFAALSNGQLIKKPSSIKILSIAKKKIQRALSRKKKGSVRRAKNVLKLRKIEIKLVNIRKDFHHKLSTSLSKNHAMIVVENLKIVNISKSAKGTLEDPGMNVRSKSGLNREILLNGWGNFVNMLKYKQKYSGGTFISVSPINTSRRCSACGTIDKKSRVRQEWYACTKCSHEMHADTNAAINILAAGRVAVRDIANASSQIDVLLR